MSKWLLFFRFCDIIHKNYLDSLRSCLPIKGTLYIKGEITILKKRLFSISSEPVTVYPDREHQPDYRVIHNKIHVSITVETKAPFRIRIGNAVLKDKNGNDLSPRNGKNTSIKYPVLLTNSSDNKLLFWKWWLRTFGWSFIYNWCFWSRLWWNWKIHFFVAKWFMVANKFSKKAMPKRSQTIPQRIKRKSKDMR